MNAPLNKLDYGSPAEANDFGLELKHLDASRYQHGERLGWLLVIYRRLIAELTPFARQLRNGLSTNRQEPLLQPWLKTWVPDKISNEALFDVQLQLDARGLDPKVLAKTSALPALLLNQSDLCILRSAPLEAIRHWTTCQPLLPAPTDKDRYRLAFRLVLESFFDERGTFGTAEELNSFFTGAYPTLAAKYGTDDYDGRLTFRYANWFQLWLEHRRRAVANLPAEHTYYELDFDILVRNVPEVVWWNTGLPYENGRLAFSYYSPEFFWLAGGGSLRKLPNHPPYSKRMAKEFLALPRDLITGNADLYVYCFLRSLDAGHDLAVTLQRFFRRPAEASLLQEWKQLLDPIVQKLRGAEFDWLAGEGDNLLGYLYHCVRDLFGFAINAQSIAQLEREANAYYLRIDARRTANERRRAAREAARQREKKSESWSPLPNVKPWEEEIGVYAKVRRWKITELTNRTQLLAEGAGMRHCVASYFQHCRKRQASIWSLRELMHNGQWLSRVTIEIRPGNLTIMQIRGRLNAEPGEKHMERIRAWAEREGLLLRS